MNRNQIAFYKKVAKRSGKDPDSIRRFVEAEAIFPDLVEMAMEGHNPIACLSGLVEKNPRVRNAKVKP